MVRALAYGAGSMSYGESYHTQIAGQYPDMYQSPVDGKSLIAGLAPWFGVPSGVQDLNPDDRRSVEKHLMTDMWEERAPMQVARLLRFMVEDQSGWWFRLCPIRFNPTGKLEWSILTVNRTVLDLAPELVQPRNVTTSYEKHLSKMRRFNKGTSLTLDRFATREGQEEMRLKLASFGSAAVVTAKLLVSRATLVAKMYYTAYSAVYGPKQQSPSMDDLESRHDMMFGASAKNERFIYELLAYARQIASTTNVEFTDAVVPFGTLDLLTFSNAFELERDRRGPKSESRLQSAGKALARDIAGLSVWEDNRWSDLTSISKRDQELLVSRRSVGRYHVISPQDAVQYAGTPEFDARALSTIKVRDMDAGNDSDVEVSLAAALDKTMRFDSNGLPHPFHEQLATMASQNSLPTGVAGVRTDENGRRVIDPLIYQDGNVFRVAKTIGDMELSAFPLELQVKMAEQIVATQLKRGTLTREDIEAVRRLADLSDRLYSPAALTGDVAATLRAAGSATAGSSNLAAAGSYGAPELPSGVAVPYGYVTLEALRRIANEGSASGVDGDIVRTAREGVAAVERLYDVVQRVFVSACARQRGRANGNVLRSNPFTDGRFAPFFVQTGNARRDGQSAFFDNLVTGGRFPVYVAAGDVAVGGGAGGASLSSQIGVDGRSAAGRRINALSALSGVAAAAAGLVQQLAAGTASLNLQEYLASDAASGYFVGDAEPGDDETRLQALVRTALNTGDDEKDARALGAVLLLASRNGGLSRQFIDNIRNAASSAGAQSFTALGGAAVANARGAPGAWINTRLSIDPDVLRAAQRAGTLGDVRPANPQDISAALDSGNDNDLEALISYARAGRLGQSPKYTSASMRTSASGPDAQLLSPTQQQRFEHISSVSSDPVARSVGLLIGTAPLCVDQLRAFVDPARGNTLSPVSVVHANPFAMFDMGDLLLFQAGENTGQTHYNFPHVSTQYNSNKKLIQVHATAWVDAQVFDVRKLLRIPSVFFRGYCAGMNTAVFETPEQWAQVRNSQRFLQSPQRGQRSGFFFLCGGSTSRATLPRSLYLNGAFDSAQFQGCQPSDYSQQRPVMDSAAYYATLLGFGELDSSVATPESYYDARNPIINTRSTPGYQKMYNPVTRQWDRCEEGRGPLPSVLEGELAPLFAGRTMRPTNTTFVSPLNVKA